MSNDHHNSRRRALPSIRSSISVVIVSITLCAARAALAAPDMVGVRATGMANAVRASATGTSGPLLNPAGMSLTRGYVIGALYQFRSDDSASQMQAAIVDSVTARVAAGLFYNFLHGRPARTFAQPYPDPAIALKETHRAHEVGFAVSVPFGSSFLLGTTTRYINYRVGFPDDAPESINDLKISKFTLDVGGIMRFGQALRVAVVGQNLIPVNDQLYPQGLGLGLAYGVNEQLTAEFDTLLDFTSREKGVTAQISGGMEFLLGKAVGIRAGALHDTYRQATYITAGGILRGGRAGIEVSVSQQVDGGEGTLVSAGVQISMQ